MHAKLLQPRNCLPGTLSVARVGPQTRGLRDAGGVTWNLRISKAGGFESFTFGLPQLECVITCDKRRQGACTKMLSSRCFFFVPSQVVATFYLQFFGTFKAEQAEEVCDQMLHHFFCTQAPCSFTFSEAHRCVELNGVDSCTEPLGCDFFLDGSFLFGSTAGYDQRLRHST